MECLSNELKVEIFRYVSTPISLVLLNRNWYSISQEPQTRSGWLMLKYGKAHALFHAIRLGKEFVSVEVVRALFAKKAVISQYFVQKLLMHYGMQDSKLIDMKLKYHMKVEIPKKNPWASQIPLSVFTEIINEAIRESNGDIAIKGNDMELFHYLTAGTLEISQAPQALTRNFEEIKDLILNKKFIPFPPRKRTSPAYRTPTGSFPEEQYPSQDGFENYRQVNLISRAILIRPELVNLWKQVGYHEICTDMNEVVVKGTLLVIYPPNPPDNWVCPNSGVVTERLKMLVNLGFEVTDSIIEESITLFEDRIKTIGESMMESFNMIRGDSTPEVVTSTLIEIRKPKKRTRRRRQQP